MNVFTADPRDAFANNGNGCNACCCGQATARPGETNKWTINYAPWSLPLGGRGLTDRVDFSIEAQRQSPDGRAPTNTNKFFAGTFNEEIEGVLSTGAVDPLDGELSYELYQLSMPKFGDVTVNPDGTFVYTPTLGFFGYDTFYYITKNEAKQVVNQVIIAIPVLNGAPLPAKDFDKPISINQKSVRVDKSLHILTFGVVASPIAQLGDIYRMNIRQHAIDCDCQEYTHISCYDITIVNC